MQPGFWDIRSKEVHFLSVKYLTGLLQNPAVSIYTVDIVTAGFCNNPAKYFMLLRGVPPTQKHVVMIIFKSKYICNENIQDFELQV